MILTYCIWYEMEVAKHDNIISIRGKKAPIQFG
jgi:hypothetical protein